MATTASLFYVIAQITGIGGTAWLSGNIACCSLLAVPALSQSHQDDSVPVRALVTQWARLYDKGATQNPPISVGIASILSFLAWTADATVWSLGLASPRQLYITSVALTVAIVPWTLLIMKRTNGALHEKAKKAKLSSAAAAKGVEVWTAVDDEEVLALLRSWTTLNGLRSMLPMLGFATGMLAALL
ncbi:hypothetical protein LTR84_001716 [Exophiala bonariae]|uniref:DUF1772-domain-containing protein n=1 Tax=Exophiala bonariae TaxID=1690606 RepID=A0AAV9NB38_9EURO|nr:hypothetical protein LTR84_001716 [Exophiala bonariae]